MNNSLIGGIISAILAVVLYIKIELIKDMIKKVTSDKEKVSLYSLVFLLLVAIIPVIIGSSIPQPQKEEIPKDDFIIKQASDDTREKNKTEILVQAGEEAVNLTKDIIEKNQEKRRKNDSIYLANKPKRWVYQLGDLMDNDESIIEAYGKMNKTEDICLFNDNGNFFFFKNVDWDKSKLEDSLDNYKSQISGVKIIDLMKYCTKESHQIKKTKAKKLGRRKSRIKIDCYTIEN